MTGRYEARPERQNEYFIPGEGISREVIQADICRYLGNDALVRPGNHNVRPPRFLHPCLSESHICKSWKSSTGKCQVGILTTPWIQEMITDLKADSARWEADVSRRADLGYPRGSYIQDMNVSHAPNPPPANYSTSSIHEVRQSQGPSPTPFTAAPAQSYMDPYSQSPYSGSQSAPYTNPSSYTSSTHSPYASGTAPYPPPQVSYSGASQPIVTAADMHPQSYTYAPTGYGGYDNGRSNAPRYPGPGYDADQDYSPVTSGMAYPTTTAPDPRIGGMEPRYTPEYERRPQATRNDPHRRR
ncbi:unnamed protein product [Penicillium salamii]|uniref:Transcription factor RfeG n=1 Tax=Penicillium salamii TaxID=1612424 RepID=A0A9W4N126_9EURO|nr:unnamed protein product [Penicillium salamii]CAG8251111.1 unnamed protein product [Penicillium salamii]CAG8340760.1 unnamed protein product [Penicillium salamii]CAG8377048.1 unnamed protein product [Penicillium salamii]CAG8401286.1 unnamed protein product [Penicillium salamii]